MEAAILLAIPLTAIVACVIATLLSLRKELMERRRMYGVLTNGGGQAMEHLNDTVRRTIAEQHDEITALKAENAKLRELVKDIDEVADPPLREFIVRRMRRLGIEVDG